MAGKGMYTTVNVNADTDSDRTRDGGHDTSGVYQVVDMSANNGSEYQNQSGFHANNEYQTQGQQPYQETHQGNNNFQPNTGYQQNPNFQQNTGYQPNPGFVDNNYQNTGYDNGFQGNIATPNNGGINEKPRTGTGISGRLPSLPSDPRLRIHWRYPAAAIGLFIASLLFAVGHDLYYLRLDGDLADADNTGSASTNFLTEINALTSEGGSAQQTWALRIGTALAFLNKTCLAAVVALVAAQQVWYTLRRTAMTVDSIDGLFDILNNPFAIFGSWDIIWHAKVVVLVALLSWSLPLASVVTPATLSVVSRPREQTVSQSVPAVNLSSDSQWASFEGAGIIKGTHFSIATLFSNVYSSVSAEGRASGSDGMVPIAAPFPNSSYDQTLYGPSYKCMSLKEALALNNGAGIQPTWTLDSPKGTGNTTYKTFEDVFYGELSIPKPGTNQTETGPPHSKVYTAAAPHYLFNMILIATTGTNLMWDDSPSNLNESTSGSQIVCQLYNTSYDVTLNFVDGIQTVVPRNVTLLEPQDWSGTAGAYSDLKTCAGINANSKAPYNTTYGNCGQATSTYYVTHLLFSYLLSATLRVAADGGVGFQGPGGSSSSMSAAGSATLPLLQSPLIHCADIYNSTTLKQSDLSTGTSIKPARCRNQTLAAAIEDLSRNFTYSLLAFDGWDEPRPTTQATITFTESRLFFVYSRTTLWAAYAAALGATLVAMLVVGVRALLHNGVVSSTSFSSTLLTTRSDQLKDAILNSGADSVSTFRRSVGAQPVDPSVGQLRLRFGHIVEQQRDGRHVEYAGFGLEGMVRPWREEDDRI